MSQLNTAESNGQRSSRTAGLPNLGVAAAVGTMDDVAMSCSATLSRQLACKAEGLRVLKHGQRWQTWPNAET